MSTLHRFLLLASFLLVTSCAQSSKRLGPLRADGTLNLGDHSFPITTKSREAQEAFDRGLVQTYAFSHLAAEQEFRRAAELDPEAAMPWWGVALVNGPHINFPLVPAQNAKVAWEALGEAQKRTGNASKLERRMIEALSTRYAEHYSEDRKALDAAYAEAMRSLRAEYSEHSDILALTAESAMNLRPWDYWSRDGKPQPGMDAVISDLDAAIELDGRNPMAHHLAIHLWEASATPERALPSADTLQSLVPGAGHLVHMPAHIYARVGRWEDSANSNLHAIEADRAYRTIYPNPGFYAMYMAHNRHFLAFSRMMEGRRADALAAARSVVEGVPEEFLRDFSGVADGFMVFVHKVMMRFGMWNELLAEPPPRAGLPLSTALWHYTRAAAQTALGNFSEASKEQRKFKTAAKKVPQGYHFGNNSAADLLKIADLVLAGEMAAKREQWDTSVGSLKSAVAIEDTLKYDEPPDWVLPVRHVLGGVLVQAGRYPEAVAVYEEDLKRYPENGWSLYGLSRALSLQGKEGEAAQVRARFDHAWRSADVQIRSSCLCQAGR